MRQGYARNVTAFPDYLVEILDMIAEGDQVVVEWTHRGVHRGPYERWRMKKVRFCSIQKNEQPSLSQSSE